MVRFPHPAPLTLVLESSVRGNQGGGSEEIKKWGSWAPWPKKPSHLNEARGIEKDQRFPTIHLQLFGRE